MVPVRELAATASGRVPTAMVAVILTAEPTARDAPLAGDAKTTAASADANTVITVVARITTRCVSFMVSCLLAGPHLRGLPQARFPVPRFPRFPRKAKAFVMLILLWTRCPLAP